MKPRLQQQVASALEAPPQLLPYIHELLVDLPELGGSSQVVLRLLQPLGLPPGSRVLDLGCGKGAVLLLLAERQGMQGLGVDAMAPFIAEARQRAAARGLQQTCEFVCADLHEIARRSSGFDVAMSLAVGAAIGTPAQLVGLLRDCLRPGGYMVIDDAFLDSTATPAPGYESYADHDTTVGQLLSHGDTMLAEHIPPRSEVLHELEGAARLIEQRAREVTGRHPELAEVVQEYVRRQQMECELVQGAVVNAVWLLQRAR